MLRVSDWFCLGLSSAGSWGGGPSAYPSVGFGANVGMVGCYHIFLTLALNNPKRVINLIIIRIFQLEWIYLSRTLTSFKGTVRVYKVRILKPSALLFVWLLGFLHEKTRHTLFLPYILCPLCYVAPPVSRECFCATVSLHHLCNLFFLLMSNMATLYLDESFYLLKERASLFSNIWALIL